jgi:diguanylate cyclase (GGDEF)-like protein
MMINRLMNLLAPKGVLGFFTRFLLFLSLVAAANFAFDFVTGHHVHSFRYYFAHGLIVSGPFIAFFLAVTVFQIRLQRKLSRLSRKDPLTGLNNRRSFFEIVERMRVIDGRGVLLLIDADHFKAINDTYGHGAGDRCLKSIAHSIKRDVRRGDVVGRIGGEEFAVYLRATTRGHAKVIGERLTRPITFHGEDGFPLSVTLSVGAAIGIPGERLQDIFARADQALYRAKQEGRAQVVFAMPGLAA